MVINYKKVSVRRTIQTVEQTALAVGLMRISTNRVIRAQICFLAEACCRRADEHEGAIFQNENVTDLDTAWMSGSAQCRKMNYSSHWFYLLAPVLPSGTLPHLCCCRFNLIYSSLIFTHLFLNSQRHNDSNYCETESGRTVHCGVLFFF